MQIGVPDVSLLTFTFSPAWIARDIFKDESRMWPVPRRQTRRRSRRRLPSLDRTGERSRRNGETVLLLIFKIVVRKTSTGQQLEISL